MGRCLLAILVGCLVADAAVAASIRPIGGGASRLDTLALERGSDGGINVLVRDRLSPFWANPDAAFPWTRTSLAKRDKTWSFAQYEFASRSMEFGFLQSWPSHPSPFMSSQTSSNGFVAFSVVGAEVEYALSGSFVGGRVSVSLENTTTDTSLFSESQGIQQEHLGGEEAVGSTRGLLSPGHEYLLRWSFGRNTFTNSWPTLSGSAQGSLLFRLVPEPATGVMVAMGLAVLGERRRRARPAA